MANMFEADFDNELLSPISSFPTTSFDFSSLNIPESSSSEGGVSWSPDDHFFAAIPSVSQQSDLAKGSLLSSSAEPCHYSLSTTSSIFTTTTRDTQVLDKGQVCLKAESCNALALKTIRKLHVTVEDCLSNTDGMSFENTTNKRPGESPQRPQARPTDAVLAQSAEVSPAIHTILKCTCCARPQLQMLTATILEKLIKWSGAIVQSTYAGAASRQSGGEQVLRQPIAIGSHQLDGELEVLAISHLILERLQELEELVDMLSDRMEESNALVGSKMEGVLVAMPLREVGLLEIVRDRLSVCLKRQIGIVREEILRLRENIRILKQ